MPRCRSKIIMYLNFILSLTVRISTVRTRFVPDSLSFENSPHIFTSYQTSGTPAPKRTKEISCFTCLICWSKIEILLLQYSPTCYHNPIFDRYYIYIYTYQSCQLKSLLIQQFFFLSRLMTRIWQEMTFAYIGCMTSVITCSPIVNCTQ